MSTTIQFTQVPPTVRKPGFYGELNLRLSQAGLPANDNRLLLIGCKTSGTQAVDTPVRILSSADGESLFGLGCELDLMIKAAWRVSPYVEIWACAVTEPTGTAANQTITLAGEATAAGVLKVTIAGRDVLVEVAKSDAAATVAAALAAAISGDHPVTALAADAVVTLTCRSKGLNGNQIRLSRDHSGCPGITATLGNTTLLGGLGSVSLTSLLTAIAPVRYHKIALSEAVATALSDLRDHCDANADATEQRGQQCIVAMTGSLSDATTLAGDENGARAQVVLLHESDSLPWVIAAAMGAARAYRCGLDPAANLDGMELPGLLPPAEGAGLTRAEVETALRNGVTPLEEVAGGKVAVVRSITTYVEDAAGAPDTSLLETATIDTMDYVRDAVRAAYRVEHLGKKITAQRPAQVRSTILRTLKDLERQEVLRDVDEHADATVVQPHPTDVHRLDAQVPSEVVPGLHVLAARFDLYLA